MKRILIMLVGCLCLGACRRPIPVFIDVERATIYHGQTVTSLYENFGIPKKQSIEPYNIRILYYKFEEIQQRELGKKHLFCDLTVRLDDDVVIDWEWNGNKCHVEVDEKDFYLDAD